MPILTNVLKKRSNALLLLLMAAISAPTSFAQSLDEPAATEEETAATPATTNEETQTPAATTAPSATTPANSSNQVERVRVAMPRALVEYIQELAAQQNLSSQIEVLPNENTNTPGATTNNNAPARRPIDWRRANLQTGYTYQSNSGHGLGVQARLSLNSDQQENSYFNFEIVTGPRSMQPGYSSTLPNFHFEYGRIIAALPFAISGVRLPVYGAINGHRNEGLNHLYNYEMRVFTVAQYRGAGQSTMENMQSRFVSANGRPIRFGVRAELGANAGFGEFISRDLNARGEFVGGLMPYLGISAHLTGQICWVDRRNNVCLVGSVQQLAALVRINSNLSTGVEYRRQIGRNGRVYDVFYANAGYQFQGEVNPVTSASQHVGGINVGISR